MDERTQGHALHKSPHGNGTYVAAAPGGTLLPDFPKPSKLSLPEDVPHEKVSYNERQTVPVCVEFIVRTISQQLKQTRPFHVSCFKPEYENLFQVNIFSTGEDVSHYVSSSLSKNTGHYSKSKLWRGALT